ISHLYLCPYLHMYFFFSSRRRHTRFSRDWSSDVCSSDLTNLIVSSTRRTVRNTLSTDFLTVVCNSCRLANTLCRYRQWISRILQIGRASCREREKNSEIAKSLKKEKK